MNTEVDPDLKNWIKADEGYSAKPYKDTVNKTTIGWGRNLDDNGIRSDEAELMIDNDIKASIHDLKQYSWYLIQPQGVKNALINMRFNLGMPRLLTFRKMIDALINKNYTKAALEALDSKWASQVGRRAKDIALIIREGK